MAKKTILVTGAAGLVGQNLVPRLVQKGYRVIALDKLEQNLDLLKEITPRVEAHRVDMAIKGDWMQLFSEADVVVDLKAQVAAPKADTCERNNVVAQRNVLAACKRYKIQNLVHMSSSVVISVVDDDYTNTKKKGEALVHKSNIPHTILRPPLMYGCFDAKHLGSITAIMEKVPIVPIPGDGRYIRQPLYVMDMCDVILKCIERKPKNKAYNIIGHEKIPFIDIVRTIAKEKRLRRWILPMPVPLFALGVNAFGRLSGTSAFTEAQLHALVAGDDFPVDDWTKEFSVEYTPFLDGLRETYTSPYFRYAKRMVCPK